MGTPEEGMEHLHEVRLHPSPFPGSQNDAYNFLHVPISLAELNNLYYGCWD